MAQSLDVFIGHRARRERAEQLLWHMADFRRFCALLKVTTTTGELRPLILNPIQRAYLAAATQRDIVLKPRQIGMTTILLARDLYRFLTIEGAKVVVVCQSMTGDGPVNGIARIIRTYIRSLADAGLELRLSVERHNEWGLAAKRSSLAIIVAGASEASAQKVGRSGTITHLHCTEAALWEWADETFNALNPCVPGEQFGSEIVIESTPNGAGGFYFERWQKAVRRENGYRPHFFRWYEHPDYRLALEPGERIVPANDNEQMLVDQGVAPAQLKWLRHRISDQGADKTAQEFPSDSESCFLVSGRSFFDMKVVEQLRREALPPRRELRTLPDFIQQRPPLPSITVGGTLLIWAERRPGVHYVVSVDPAEGKVTSGNNERDNSDFCSAKVLGRDGLHYATLHGRWEPWEFARRLAPLARMYDDAEIAVERNNHGHAVLQALDRHLHYPNIWRDADGALGWISNHQKRTRVLDQLKDALHEGHARTSDMLFLGEARTFVIGPDGKAQAIPGTHDDTVLDYAIGWDVICRPRATPRYLQNLTAR